MKIQQTLHTLNGSSREYPALLDRLLRAASPGDSLLLLEDGVYCITDEKSLQHIQTHDLQLFCLEADITARGLQVSLQKLHSLSQYLCTNVDDEGFVDLACAHQKVVSWFT